MVTLVPGKSRCTASAMTCAVECRRMARPSASDVRTGSIFVPSMRVNGVWTS